VPVIDTSLLPPASWKNGGGSTRTLAVSPEGAGFDDFIWRVSIAEVRGSGDFSLFPGVDRTILLLDGRGMMLHHEDGSIHALTTPFRPWRMRGDDPVRAWLLNGSARDFNVMVRRGCADSVVDVWQAETALPGFHGDAVFFCARGSFRVSTAAGEDVVLSSGCAFHVPVAGEAMLVAPAAPNAILVGAFLKPAEQPKREEQR
jgi:environmental stress-induced protein Ves